MDTTSLIIEGQNARFTMQEAKRRNKAEIRRKYEAKMRAEIDEANVEAEVTFANTLARIFATGLLTVREIQRETLRESRPSVLLPLQSVLSENKSSAAGTGPGIRSYLRTR